MNITIRLNGEPRPVEAGTTLDALLAQLGVPPQQVATAVNADFIARDARPSRTLREGDEVMTFQPIVGG